MMARVSLIAILVGLPALAQAQQVPAIANATANATATATSTRAMPTEAGQGAASGVPATMPPRIQLPAPSASLNAKEKHAVTLARKWASRSVMPHAGADGVVRFLYGATMPTVVCAPLQVCDLALQPGEIVNNVNVGDKVRWNISPAISGGTGGPVTHLIIKPDDAGLVSSMTIETDRRTYAVKLVSTQRQWMALVGFNYPDDTDRSWGAYRANVASVTATATAGGGNLQFLCISPSRGGPSWTPRRAYTDGSKTYIEFPRSLSGSAAPALVALANDGSWFSRPTAQMVNYRTIGNRYVVDATLDRAELISGVGGDQERVTLTRGDGCQ
jgi:type IV secretion system protein VirB9